jgi:RNA polymerase sigma factor (TIGR02999 family)
LRAHRPPCMLGPMSDVTRLLDAAAAGESHAAAELLPLVYDELRKLAAARLAAERPGQTLEPTALVHEAYLRLVGDHKFAGRHHFFRVAASAMRRILVDRARRKGRARHGGDRDRVPLADAEPAAAAPADDLVALDEALGRFAAIDPAKAELVELRYFAGLSEEDAAAALGISRATASRYWAYARAWLIDALDTKSE